MNTKISGSPSPTPGTTRSKGANTTSLCPVCLARIPAIRAQEGASVYLVKECPEHGNFRTVIWREPVPFSSWLRPKSPSPPSPHFTLPNEGCPFDCGLCKNHGQHTCTALIEITNRCNLNCPICFAAANHPSTHSTQKEAEPSLERIGYCYDRIMAGSGPCNIQLSGGEPTMRDDLWKIIELGKSKGFPFLQLNSNGLRLAETPSYGKSLKAAGLDSVFLQFDGLEESSHKSLRGCDLRQVKERAIVNCREAGLAVVLVPTLVPGVNDHELGEIISFAASHSPTVRGVHFQPISYFGRFPQAPKDKDRLTLPEIMALIEKQTGGAISSSSFSPPGCEHALCSFSGNFLVEEDGSLRSLGQTKTSCCSTGTGDAQTEIGPLPSALEGRRKSVAFTARQWAMPSTAVREKSKECQQTTSAQSGDDLDRFLVRARTHTFSISAMAFQDAWNLDLERLQGCCIHVVSSDGNLIPFCAYNLTSASGQPLYRREGQP